jgi:hypothetical protein
LASHLGSEVHLLLQFGLLDSGTCMELLLFLLVSKTIVLLRVYCTLTHFFSLSVCLPLFFHLHSLLGGKMAFILLNNDFGYIFNKDLSLRSLHRIGHLTLHEFLSLFTNEVHFKYFSHRWPVCWIFLKQQVDQLRQLLTVNIRYGLLLGANDQIDEGEQVHASEWVLQGAKLVENDS